MKFGQPVETPKLTTILARGSALYGLDDEGRVWVARNSAQDDGKLIWEWVPGEFRG